MAGLVPEYTINGSFGEVRDQDGLWLANVQEVTYRVTIARADINVSGSRRMKYKALGTSGEGNLRQFKVTTEFAKRVTELMRGERQLQFVGQLMVKIDDPEALGVERALLKGVKFWEIDGGWRVNELVEENIPFTFDDIEYPDEISGDMTTPQARYAALG